MHIRFITLSFVLFFSCFFGINGWTQTCIELKAWTEKAKATQSTGDYNCEEINKALQSVLASCLLSKDSFDSSLWNLYLELGYNYYLCGPEEKCTVYLHQAIKAIKNTTNPIPQDLGRIYRLLAKNYNYLGRNDEALPAINKAIEFFEINNSEYLSSSYRLLAEIYSDYGDYNQALLYLTKADETSQSEELHKIFMIKTTKAIIYSNLNKYDIALEEYKAAKTILEKDGIEKYSVDYPQVHGDIGHLYLLLGNYSAASTYLNKALELYKKVPSIASENYITTYTYQADLQIQLEQYDKAKTSINNAFAIADNDSTSLYLLYSSELYRLRGIANTKQKKFNNGIDDFQKGILALVPSFDSKRSNNPILALQPVGDKIKLRALLELKAKAFIQKYESHQKLDYLKEAHAVYLTLDTLITQTRQSFRSVGSKYFLQKTIVPIYEEAIDVALQLYKITSKNFYLESAYQFISRNKAIILIEGLQNEKVKFSTIPDQLIQQEIQLKKNYYDWEVSLHEEENKKDSKIIQQTKDSLFATKRAYDKLIQTFEKDYPKYYQFKHNFYSQVKSKDIQSRIESNRAIIEFFIGEKSIYVSVITKNQHDILQTPLPDDFENLCIDFIEMAIGESNDNLEKRFSERSYQLYQYLLDPALASLNPTIDRLTIIPDDILLHLPFDVLLTKPFDMKPKDWASSNMPYLIRKFPYNQVYSNSLIFNEDAQNKVKHPSKNFLGFGLEYFDFTSKEKLTKKDSLVQKRASGPLPFSKEEVLEIQAIMGGQVVIDKEATKQFFLNNATNYNIFHFSMHGYADEKSPLNSALVFAKTKEQNDNLLRAADIYSIDIAASLVYLSACQTNYATVQKGEGMPTISRAFAYAGCPSIVASLRDIPDKSSKEIATAFYNNLKNKQPKDVALRNAKLSYLKNVTDINNALPYRWSQTVLIGDTSPLEVSGNSNRLLFIIAVSLLALLLFFLTKKK